MENLGEIRGKCENILWNWKILQGFSQEILKKYAKKNFEEMVMILEIL